MDVFNQHQHTENRQQKGFDISLKMDIEMELSRDFFLFEQIEYQF